MCLSGCTKRGIGCSRTSTWIDHFQDSSMKHRIPQVCEVSQTNRKFSCERVVRELKLPEVDQVSNLNWDFPCHVIVGKVQVDKFFKVSNLYWNCSLATSAIQVQPSQVGKLQHLFWKQKRIKKIISKAQVSKTDHVLERFIRESIKIKENTQSRASNQSRRSKAQHVQQRFKKPYLKLLQLSSCICSLAIYDLQFQYYFLSLVITREQVSCLHVREVVSQLF